MGDLRILNQLGPRATTVIEEAFPDATVVELEPDFSDAHDGPGEILLAPGRAPGRGTWDDVRDQCLRSGVRWVHIAGAGAGEPPDRMFEDGRRITCSRGAFAAPIAEYVLAAMLAFEKRHPSIFIDEPPAEPWGFPSRPPAVPEVPDPLPGPPPRWGWAPLGGLEGKTLGIVGLGGIGERVARHAVGFDMDVVALRRRNIASSVEGVRVVQDLDEVLDVADHLVIAAAGTAATEKIIDARALARVKPGLHLVNVARGSLVDQDALLEAIAGGRVAMATLDSVVPEPLPEGHPIYSNPRVRLSPHVSWNGPRAQAPIVELFVANLRRYVAGEPLEGLVDAIERY
jgi:phosphoglycerate dehydrogenase-like enzyme